MSHRDGDCPRPRPNSRPSLALGALAVEAIRFGDRGVVLSSVDLASGQPLLGLRLLEGAVTPQHPDDVFLVDRRDFSAAIGSPDGAHVVVGRALLEQTLAAGFPRVDLGWRRSRRWGASDKRRSRSTCLIQRWRPVDQGRRVRIDLLLRARTATVAVGVSVAMSPTARGSSSSTMAPS